MRGEAHIEYRFDKASGTRKAAIVTHIGVFRRRANEGDRLNGMSQSFGSDENGQFVETTAKKVLDSRDGVKYN